MDRDELLERIKKGLLDCGVYHDDLEWMAERIARRILDEDGGRTDSAFGRPGDRRPCENNWHKPDKWVMTPDESQDSVAGAADNEEKQPEDNQ
ncbi:MAG TPA: D-aminoacyl-tRNA deacylase [Firmicutes bacterium]|nr:D-aminoacyl-tRNA deacylase [Bacillota bacterium]